MSKSEVNILEFYQRTWKYLVYSHIECGYFWIHRGCSVREANRCPRCHKMQAEALASFSTQKEAEEYHIYLVIQRQDEMHQLKVAKMLNERINLIEATKPKQTAIINGVVVTHPFNGDFYTKWLSWWSTIQWPNQEAFGVNTSKNQTSNWNFGPKIEEKVYTWEAPATSKYQNLSTWSTEKK